MRKVILASQSRARKILFSSLGVPFVTLPANINEKEIRNKDLSRRAEKIARKKAEKICITESGIIISADTYSESEGRVFEKPTDKKEAIEMLKFLSGKSAINYTGFCYIDTEKKINYSTVIKTKYKVRELYKNEIKEYVNKFPVTEWAAGFALIEPYIISFIEKVDGSFTSLAYGLPTEVLIPLLKKSGIEPKPQ